MGEPEGARAAAVHARRLVPGASAFGFIAARCDYQEGEAANFGRAYDDAERLLKRARKAFEALGQDQFVARCEAAIGTVFANRGDDGSALPHFDRAMALFDPTSEKLALPMTLNNQASSLARLGRYDEARMRYARALSIGLRHGLMSHIRYVRSGLAELDLLRGRFAQALGAFREIAADSAANGSITDQLFARLYVAECLGRVGQFEEMSVELEALRKLRRKTRFGPSPALEDLFSCFDKGTTDADLVAHVREYLQNAERGIKRSYRVLRRA